MIGKELEIIENSPSERINVFVLTDYSKLEKITLAGTEAKMSQRTSGKMRWVSRWDDPQRKRGRAR